MEKNDLASLLRDFAQGASNSAASNVAIPVDAIAWLLRKGGVNVPSNPVMGSDWMAEKGFTREPQNKLAGLVGDMAGMVAPFAAAAKAPQIAKGLLIAGEAMPMGSKAVPSANGNQLGAVNLGNERLLKILERNGESVAPNFAYPQSEAIKPSLVSEGAATRSTGATASPDGINFFGATYYEDPKIRQTKVNDLYRIFGGFGTGKGMSPQTARSLYEKGMLKASKKEIDLLLDMTDSSGAIRPQISPPN